MLTEFEALEANLRQSFRILAEGRPRAGLAELDGVSIASLGAQFQMFNAAFLHRRVASRDDLERRLDIARGFFESNRMPWAFWVCEEWLAWPARRVLAGMCQDLGMQPVAEMPGMVADSLRASGGFLQKSRPAAVLDIRRAEGPRMMDDFRAIGSACFHVPPVWFSEVFDDSIPSREFVCWVGYRGGKPVATAATVTSDGVIGLYNIATVPEEQRRGYGEAITRHAIAAASSASGLRRVILQSTSQGERLYKRLGFREVSRLVVFNSTVTK